MAVPDSDHLPYGRCSGATPAELHGSGARSTQSAAQAVFLARLLAVERATPNQFRSDTFCRGLVVMSAGEAGTPERLLRRAFYEPAGVWESRSVSRADPIETRASLLSRSSPSQKTLLARGLSGTRAASHPPPRRDGRYAAPKVPSIEGKPELGGYALGKPSATPRPPVRTEILSDGRSRMVWSFLHRLFPACE